MNKIKFISESNLETYTETVKSKLDERISEPTEDGTKDMVLKTDGNGIRYWSEIGRPASCTKEEIEEIVNFN